jgi:hypothetical protein
MAARALNYDPAREAWEKRIARYLSWQWRIRANKRTYFQPFRIETLLEVIGAIPDPRPGRIEARLEKCLNRLKQDGVIADWDYWPSRPLIEPWRTAKIHVEPLGDVLNCYSGEPPANVTTEMILFRRKRQENGLTVLAASSKSKISPEQLYLFEMGLETPSDAEQKQLLECVVRRRGTGAGRIAHAPQSAA